jgi:predicted small lipoprotein YifL
MKTIFTRIGAIALAATILTLINGCGNKGPLVPPKTQVATNVSIFR